MELEHHGIAPSRQPFVLRMVVELEHHGIQLARQPFVLRMVEELEHHGKLLSRRSSQLVLVLEHPDIVHLRRLSQRYFQLVL